MAIKDVLDSLNDEQRRLLMYAFEHGIAQHVVLPDKKFIGVNVNHIKHLRIGEEAGVWATGEVLGENNG